MDADVQMMDEEPEAGFVDDLPEQIQQKRKGNRKQELPVSSAKVSVSRTWALGSSRGVLSAHTEQEGPSG